MAVKSDLKFMVLITAMLLSPPAMCDTFFMKSGNTLEGIVISETDGLIELDVGYGTVSIEKSAILKIKKPTPKERAAAKKKKRLETFASGEYAPAGAERLSKLLLAIRSKRKLAIKAKARKSALKTESKALEAEIAGLRKNSWSLADLFQDASTSKDRNTTTIVTEDMINNNTLLVSRETRRRAISEDIEKADAQTQAYQSAYIRFADFIEGEGKPVIAREAQGIEGKYFTWIRNEIRTIRADFKTDVATSMRQGQHIIVKARINGKVTARLMVDTGASMTVLYKSIMDALKLDPKKAIGTAITTVADGRKVKADVIQLDSIEVGKSKVEETRAAIIPVESADIDGLLGMSFLSHFSVSIDPMSGNLTLLSLTRDTEGTRDAND